MSRISSAAKLLIWALGTATICVWQSPARAAPAEDLSAIRDAISNLRQEYEAKIKDLEDRLQKAESETEAAKVLLGGLLANGEVTDEAEVRFLTERLQTMKSAEKSSAPSEFR